MERSRRSSYHEGKRWVSMEWEALCNRTAALNKEWRIQVFKEAKTEEKERSWQIWRFKNDGDDFEVPVAVNKLHACTFKIVEGQQRQFS